MNLARKTIFASIGSTSVDTYAKQTLNGHKQVITKLELSINNRLTQTLVENNCTQT